ncbi:hypothetical protein COLO4_15593 [Corchorus olitorius]|uniref:Uncharacterized protein n=1 Tax=Corchorus olitorius TaxID=93759 RepID=A0A1R3JM68_9ROSI|nr:hypothetical protein COLO4_15593 [Corchorus olitorius]
MTPYICDESFDEGKEGSFWASEWVIDWVKLSY